MIKNGENEKHTTTEGSTTPQKPGLFNNKMYFVIFWIIFFIMIILITVKCVINLTDIPTLNGAFALKEYTSSDIETLTAVLTNRLEEENTSLHPGYRMDMQLSPNYQVYAGEDGKTAAVVYTVEFRGLNYTVIGYTHSNYFNGLNSLIEQRNKLINDGAYTWDNSYIPEDTDEILMPTPTPDVPPTHTSDGTPILPDVDDTDEVIERGGGEEE